jgi:hypothetical protein
VTEVLGLVAVAWLVYVSDALWWVGPDRIVLSGRDAGSMRAQLGPAFTLRQDSGVFVPRLTPPFNHHFEVGASADVDNPSDDAAIIAAAKAAMAAARPLQRLGAVLWGFCFLIAPALMMTWGLRRVWLALVVVLFGSAIAIAACFARAWRTVHPGDPRGWKNEVFPIILSPLAAICAADALTRRACASFNGLAVVSALARREEFLRIARFYYFAPGNHAVDSFLAAKDLREAVLQPPPRAGSEMEGYCPRCHTQLVRGNGDCPECLDVAIVPFGPTLSGAPSDTWQSAAPR